MLVLVPIPESDDRLCVGFERVAILARQTKVADLEDALVVQQQIRGLEVAMEYPVVVQMTHAAQQLHHQALDLTRRERSAHGLHEILDLVLEELHHEIDAARAHTHT